MNKLIEIWITILGLFLAVVLSFAVGNDYVLLGMGFFFVCFWIDNHDKF